MSSRAFFLVSFAAAVTFAPPSAQAFQERKVVSRVSALERVTLEGFVLAADGSPVVGAVVTTSAGGRAVSDSAGRYRLALEIGADNMAEYRWAFSQLDAWQRQGRSLEWLAAKKL